MEPRWLIVVCAVTTHLILALVLLPSYWGSARRSRRWSDLLVPVLIPLAFATVLAAQLLDHWSTLTSPMQVLGSLGIGAATATVIVALSRLRSFEV